MTHGDCLIIRSDGLFPVSFVDVDNGEYSVEIWADKYRSVCGTGCGFTPLQAITSPGDYRRKHIQLKLFM